VGAHPDDRIAPIRTKTHRAILEAYERGYRVTRDGRLLSPLGRQLRIARHGSEAYPRFSLNQTALTPSRVYGIPVHMFAGYCFFGRLAFTRGLQVRHLNADQLDVSWANLKMGSPSANERDKPVETRRRVARFARAAQGQRAPNRRYSDEQAAAIRDAYAEKGSRKAPQGWARALSERVGVPLPVLYTIASGARYA
jgi:hypothetical protein